MKLILGNYKTEKDYISIREFLRKIFLINDRRALSWPVQRLDYWRWHGINNMEHGSLEKDVFLWETDDGNLAAVLNREGPGEAYLNVHPHYRTAALEEEMITAAEQNLATLRPDGTHRVRIWASEQDRFRHSLLGKRGYIRGDWPEYEYRCFLELPIPETPPIAGYTIRSLESDADVPNRSWVSWRAFHPDEPAESYEGWDWYHNIQSAPLYRPDLDLVAVTEDGAFAAFCTLWYDEETKTGYFEPVGTDPDHQRRGLGKAVMREGLRRLKNLGGVMASVGGYTAAANALYASVMNKEYELYEPWVKEFDS